MKKSKLINLGVQELQIKTMLDIDGGVADLPYAKYTWNTNNRTTMDGLVNGVKFCYNGVACAWNWASNRKW